ncbi:competence CoiA-like predicted nuclease [Evansella vedderi]|uniref:Competence CoiA-like predicted nuclease n=1 Tax=Evansella vedderi TaxID=38282 RepID=A0ABT9ZVY1_9BACI|nr:competence protein CoiA family protein [Evansella vedderi]MDQ0255393.1 competence CoiA-like predicted nuclease [Evansella vedderi]
MFTANRCDGSSMSLYEKKWTRKELERDRREYQYSCPECKEKVILRLGYEQAWHFAHHANSSCRLQKGETEDHRKGKRLIVEWLKKYNYEPQVEHYLKEIKQRPDIFVIIDGKKYVFEIQRASIMEESFQKRHENYCKLNIEPIWIGIYSSINQIDKYTYSTRQLDHLLLRSAPYLHSIYLAVEDPSWYFFTHFHYLSRQKTMALPIKTEFHLPPKELLNFKVKFPMNCDNFHNLFFSKWLRELRQKRQKVYLKVTPTERKMLRVFQKFHLNLNYFPALGSLPLRKNYHFLTPPQWWQSWLIIEKINKGSLGERFSVSNITNALYQMLLSNYFHVRPINLHPKDLIREAVVEYFDALCLFQVLEKELNGIYKVKNHINIHKQLDTLCLDDVYVIEKWKGEWSRELFR